MEEVRYCLRCGHRVELRQAYGRLRPTCPHCGRIHFVDPKVAVGVLIVEAGRVLLVRRSNDPERGKWSVPAGFVDADEDPARAAEREAEEETGLKVAIDALLGVYGRRHATEGADILIVYRARVAGGALQPGDDASEAAYFPPGALPELAFISTRQIIDVWQSAGTAPATDQADPASAA